MGKLVGSEERHKAYDPDTQDRFLNEVIAPLKTTKVYFAQNVPWLFCFMVPFSALPLKTSYLVWSVLGVLCGSTLLSFLAFKTRSMTPLAIALIVLGTNACQPAWLALQHGNTAWFLVGALSLCCFGLLKNNDIAGGAGLAFLGQKPQYALLMAIPALRFARWKLLFVAAAIEVSLWLLAMLNVGVTNVIDYPRMLMSVDVNRSFDGMYPMQMVCLRAFFAAHISEATCMPLALAVFALAILALSFLWWKTRRDDTMNVRWALALTIYASVVVSPHTYLYDVLLLSVAAVLTLPDKLQLRDPRGALFTTWNCLLVFYPLTSWFLYLSESAKSAFQHESLASFNLVLLLMASISYLFIVKRNDRAHDQVQHAI